MTRLLFHTLAKVQTLTSHSPRQPSNKLVLISGIVPLIVYTIVEEVYGVYWGLIAGLVLGIVEIIVEKILYKKVSTITWIVNAMIISLGCVSLYMNDGIWFKLQPAFAEALMVIILWGSLLMKKPFLQEMAKKQMPDLPPMMQEFFGKITFRLGLFFLAHTALAIWAAFDWSTVNWALLKGVGLTVSALAYLGIEMFFFIRGNRSSFPPPKN
ncbi:MAG: septation protein IspZ [Bdellovibrionaceae bacterium]|nr:septation protein IspZ [Pseudobdellovibrionaceae bacterium]